MVIGRKSAIFGSAKKGTTPVAQKIGKILKNFSEKNSGTKTGNSNAV